jgi:hypothetical protein
MSGLTAIPGELLVATGGTIDVQGGCVEITLAPFVVEGALAAATEMEDGTRVETSVRVDSIAFSGDPSSVEDLAGRSFAFDPDDDEPDGSVYVSHAHHPVDVARIAFGAVGEGRIATTLHARVDWAFEGLGELEAQDVVLETTLASTLS